MIANDIHEAIMRFEGMHYPYCKRNDLAIIMLPSTRDKLIMENFRSRAFTIPLYTELRMQILGLPVIATTDIEQPFRIAWMPKED